MSRDPLDYWDGMNLYTYVWNNPVNWIDPFGLSKEKDNKGMFPGGYMRDPSDGEPIGPTGPENPAPVSPKAEERPVKSIPSDPTPNDPTPREPSRSPWRKVRRVVEEIIWWAARLFYNIKGPYVPFEIFPPPPGKDPEDWYGSPPPAIIKF